MEPAATVGKTETVQRAPKPRGRWWRKLLFVGFICVALVPALLLCWGAWEERQLEARLARLRAAGEPTTPADLNSPHVPDEDNAVIELRAAAASIDKDAAAWEALNEFEPLRLPFYDQELAAVRVVVAENGQALELIEPAMRKSGFDWKLTFTSPMLIPDMPDLTSQRALANLLRCAALAAHLDGDDATALRHVEEILFVAKAIGHHPTLVGHLVQTGIEAIAVDTIGQIAVDMRIGTGPRDAKAADVKGIIDTLLDETNIRSGIAQAYRGERVMGIDAMSTVAAGKSVTKSDKAPGSAQMLKARGFLLRNASGISDHFDGLLKVGSRSEDWPTFRASLAATPSPVDESPRLYFAATIFTGAMETGWRVHFTHLTQRRLAATALAISLYRAEHGGQLPADLKELTPAYLPDVPRDALIAGGKPIGYVTDAERPRLYGVGENGVDDGGRPIDETLSRAENVRLSDLVLDLRQQPKPPPAAPEEEYDEMDSPATTQRFDGAI